jgi:hypothetical protein
MERRPMSDRDRGSSGNEYPDRRTMPERTGVGDEYPDERTMDKQPGLSGGEYPGAEEETEAMSEELTPSGEATTFGGRLSAPGAEGTMGTLDETEATS